MRIEQYFWTKKSKWSPKIEIHPNENVQLVLLFGAIDILKSKRTTKSSWNFFPDKLLMYRSREISRGSLKKG